MEAENSNRTKRIIFRLTPAEYAKIEKKWKASTCRKLSDYIRHILFEKPVVTNYRNQSTDDLMLLLTELKRELSAIGNNFNQSVKRLHTLSDVAEFKRWQLVYEVEKNMFFNKVDEIRKHIQKLAEQWLR